MSSFDDFAIPMKTIKNPDKDFLKDLKKRIKKNNGYCPFEEVKSADTKCPCHAAQCKEACVCGMYIQVPSEDDNNEY